MVTRKKKFVVGFQFLRLGRCLESLIYARKNITSYLHFHAMWMFMVTTLERCLLNKTKQTPGNDESLKRYENRLGQVGIFP